MKENTLLKIAFICSLGGLISLYFISSNINPQDYNPVTSGIGSDVNLTGTISKIDQREDVTFIDVSYEKPLTIVVFNGEVSFNKGDKIQVNGRVQEYNGKQEIIAQKIKVMG